MIESALTLEYDLAQDIPALEAMARTAQNPKSFGVLPDPAYPGTAEWWNAIQTGRLASLVAEGRIGRVYWGSMGDFPEFELWASDETTTWPRHGDVTRYVGGLEAKVAFVL